MEKNNNELLKLGSAYAFQLTSGSIITGILTGRSEGIVDGRIEVCYRIKIGEKQYLDFYERELTNVHIPRLQEKLEYFKEFEKKHSIRCFDSDDNLLPASVIMGNSLIRGNVWDKLSETERIEYISHLELESKNIVELVNVYADERKRYQELHDKRMKLLDISLKFMDNFEKLKNMSPDTKSAYNLIYKELGIEKILEEIC